MSDQPSALARALHSPSPAAELADKLALYGFLIGRWEADAILYPQAGGRRELRGEIHAGWVLAGRAIQDVWILPGVFYGTTLRVYDPKLDAWHIRWIDPMMQAYPAMIGHARGRDIVQEGSDRDGASIRWSFTEISRDSFRWLGEISPDSGRTWRLQLEFSARRRP